ncbi:TPA: hypothetical protein DEP94_01990 [Candidatus Nomurabacteria bacterium]|nr:hypothetical protein [Candidatus Nomurabacteria bacterium]
MASYSLDYLFNRVYDVLLWIKYTWLFGVLRTRPEDYLALQENRNWDGLRDRGWFDNYFAAQNAVVPPADAYISLWQRLAEKLGYNLKDTDGDGIPDVSDPAPNDPSNLTSAQLKERFQSDYTFSDHVRDVFGLPPKDTDGDGVPDSYEIVHNLNLKDPDADHDGLLDGQELVLGTDPLNNDTDHDGTIDGRDEAPLDQHITSIGIDTDGDGVSDIIEAKLGTNLQLKDTDGDGISDNMDTYPLDPNNIGQIATLDFSKQTEALQLHIQSPLLAFLAQMFSILAIVGLVFFILFLLWFIYEYWSSLVHYEHHFNDSHSHGHDAHGNEEHAVGIAGLAVGEYVPPHAPTHEEFEAHPRWAIIEGYMASTTGALWRIGILEADTMLAEVLKEKGYKGEDVGEMLNSASFKTVQLAWDAHKIRNKIAHEGSTFVLTEREAKRAYALYEAVFKELKAI